MHFTENVRILTRDMIGGGEGGGSSMHFTENVRILTRDMLGGKQHALDWKCENFNTGHAGGKAAYTWLKMWEF